MDTQTQVKYAAAGTRLVPSRAENPYNCVADHCWRVSARFSVRSAVTFTLHTDYEPTKGQKWKIDEGRSALEDLHNLEALVEDDDAPFDLTVPQLNKTFRFGIPTSPAITLLIIWNIPLFLQKNLCVRSSLLTKRWSGSGLRPTGRPQTSAIMRYLVIIS